MFYVNQRWLGGLLTNMATVQKSIKRLKELEGMASVEGGYAGRPKKEVIRLERERKHLDPEPRRHKKRHARSRPIFFS